MGCAFKREMGDSGQGWDRANIVRITCVAFLFSLALSWRAYIPSVRTFELSPVIDVLGSTPIWVDWLILTLNVGCLCWLVVKPLQRAPALGTLACTVFWVLQDLLRFQPYTYMYVFTIAVAVFFASGSVNALKIMAASVYVWGGVHKINATFFFKTFPSLIEPFYTFPKEPSPLAALIALAIFMVPLFEATIGLLFLCAPRQKRLPILMALIMLVVVLACLGLSRSAWNMIVWPWNIYLFLLAFMLFYKPAEVDDRMRFRFDIPTLAAIALFTVAPAFALTGWVHSYPSLKLYSGNTKRAEVVFAPDENLTRLPNNLGKLVGRARTLSLVDWTAQELGLVVYPESDVFRQGAKGLCPYLSDRQQATLRIYDAPFFYSTDTIHQDFPLCEVESK